MKEVMAKYGMELLGPPLSSKSLPSPYLGTVSLLISQIGYTLVP